MENTVNNSIKDVHIDLKVGPIYLKLAGDTKFGVYNSFLTIRTMSDEKTDNFKIYRFLGFSVVFRC